MARSSDTPASRVDDCYITGSGWNTDLLVNLARQLVCELAQAHAELAAERQRYAQDCSDMVAYVKSFGTLNEAIKMLGARADEATRVLRLAMRYFGADAETVVLTIAEDGSTLADFQKQARAFLDAAKKVG